MLQSPNLPTPPPILGAKYGSFAYYTITQRLPDIARRVIAENNFPQPISENLENLADEVIDGFVRPLKDEEAADSELWASYVQPFLNNRWFDVPFYFAEAYFYRRVLAATHYFLPGQWHKLDPFDTQKRLGLKAALNLIRSLSTKINTWSNVQSSKDKKWEKTALRSLLYLALWGNRVDLSFGVFQEECNYTDFRREQKHILIDHSALLIEHLYGFQGINIHFILDNTGAELVCDLGLANFLLSAQIAEIVCFHLKAHPTFVSDAMSKDIHYTLDVLATDSDPALQTLAQNLRDYLALGRLVLREDFFWTSPLAFWEMPNSLHQELCNASLVVVKGDANYRRLLGDLQWPFTVALEEIACYFPVPFVALRTLKSEVATNLTPNQVGTLNKGNASWLTNGQWGVVQFVEKPLFSQIRLKNESRG